MNTPESEKPKENLPVSSSDQAEESDETSTPVEKYAQIIDGLSNLLTTKDPTKD